MVLKFFVFLLSLFASHYLHSYEPIQRVEVKPEIENVVTGAFLLGSFVVVVKCGQQIFSLQKTKQEKGNVVVSTTKQLFCAGVGFFATCYSIISSWKLYDNLTHKCSKEKN